MNKFCGLLLLCVQLHWSASALTANHVDSIGRIITVVVDTLKTCYDDEKTIVVHPDSDESTIRALENSETFTIILYKDPLKISRHIDQRKEMPIFLTTINSSEQLQERLVVFKRSPWWNVMATFFILDTSNGSCELANSIHDSTWAMSILNSFFVCLNDQQEPMFHMYNPYTNRAQSQWTQLMMMERSVSSRWTTYSRQYIQGQICDGLKFDKTKFLDDSRVMACVYILSSTPSGNATVDLDVVMLKMMQRALNVTLINKYFNYFSQSDKFEFKRLLENEWIDFYSHEVLARHVDKRYTQLTYPVNVQKYKIVTYKGHYTYMENIWNYYGTAACVTTIFILVIIYVALIIMLGTPRRYGFVALEWLRLLLNISMISPMYNRRHKIFFTVIFFIFLALHTEIDGQIASWLTEPVPQKPIDSFEDLYDERIQTIYIREQLNLEILDYHHKLTEKVTLFNENDRDWSSDRCIKLVAGNDSVACIELHDIFKHVSLVRDDVHVAREPGENIYQYYMTRLNWPLKERVDTVFMRLEQYGIRHWIEREAIRSLSNNRDGKISETPQTVDDDIKVTLTDFMPLLYIWASGIACSIICFIIELIIGRRRRSVEATKEVPLDTEFVEPPAESAVKEDISALPSCSFYRSPQRTVFKAVVHHQQQNETEF